MCVRARTSYICFNKQRGSARRISIINLTNARSAVHPKTRCYKAITADVHCGGWKKVYFPPVPGGAPRSRASFNVHGTDDPGRIYFLPLSKGRPLASFFFLFPQ